LKTKPKSTFKNIHSVSEATGTRNVDGSVVSLQEKMFLCAEWCAKALSALT
jgi:hypothetical protein